MGYILPINDFQVAQYLNRSLSNKKHYSYINSVQHVKRESRFSRALNESTRRSNLKYWKQKKLLYSHLEINSNSHHISPYENNVESVTGIGLNYNLFV
ncbi:hypothetical protein [Rummeliibacillus pycnus]|uniref:hypothetical protein n=1 Tax=Rummeliibacillus pycnus TaxID=101070 RepID=UPI000C9BDEF4|nr:hypothetical protein [Rummeliibacillus pycnus]